MNKVKLKVTLILIFIVMIVIIKNINYKSFIDYENTILSQQNDHLLTIAKSIAKNLELHVDGKVGEITNLADNLAILSVKTKLSDRLILKELKLFRKIQGKEILELRYIDKNENTAVIYPIKKLSLRDVNFNSNFKRVKATRLPYISKPFRDRAGRFVFYIYQPLIFNNNFEGIILGKIDLKNIYNKLVKSIKAGKQGYVMVKDSKGIVLMHPVKEQIGYDEIKIGEKQYPNFDFLGLKTLVNNQSKGEEGTYIYDSYWQSQKKFKKIKKMCGYSPAFIGEEFWVVSVVMSYDEISAPIKNYFYSSLLVSFIMILIFAWILSLLIRMVKNKEAYQMENSYLHELNEADEKLREKEAELHHKRKMETIGTLTGGIAHEFNNILTPIMGYSEMILRDLASDTDMYEDVKVIYDSSRRSQEIIDQILIYSDDKINFKYKVLFLSEIISGMEKIIESTLPKDTELRLVIEDKKLFIIGNETQLHQLILNLVKNAVNAMKNSKKKKLTIKLVRILDENKIKFCKLSIKDVGCGMTEETLEKIFDPFYTKKLSKNSTGLGLSVVEGIVEKHGGNIQVTSEINKGSCFNIFIPLTNAEEISYKELKEDKDPTKLEGNEKIMILDDEEFIVKMLKKGLEGLGYTTQSFEDGYDLLEEFNKSSLKVFDVLITDLTMPGIGGIELAKLLRLKNKDLKIILMTAHPKEPLESHIKNGIINEFLLKPVSAAEISRCIRKLLDNDKK
jgi:two-component system cell cycle sensor histidine kinase/response regulator CckA